VSADEVDREALLAGLRHVCVRVVEAGHGEGAVEVDDLCLGALQGEDGGVVSGRDDAALVNGEGVDAGGRRRLVGGAKVRAGEDFAVEEEGVGRGLLGWHLRRGGQGERSESQGSTG
jgi:hypothetical protein